MVTSSAYVYNSIHGKEINMQNSKMSGSNQQIEGNVGFASYNVFAFLTLTFLVYIKRTFSLVLYFLKALLYEY